MDYVVLPLPNFLHATGSSHCLDIWRITTARSDDGLKVRWPPIERCRMGI